MNVTKYVADWLARASEDLDVVALLLREQGSANTACFHAQQAAEKLLKGFLAHHERHVRKVHDLKVLLTACAEIDHSCEQLRDDVAAFVSYEFFLAIQLYVEPCLFLECTNSPLFECFLIF